MTGAYVAAGCVQVNAVLHLGPVELEKQLTSSWVGLGSNFIGSVSGLVFRFKNALINAR